jgi:hypothetical protein
VASKTGQEAKSTDEIEELLDAVDTTLDRLKTLYEQYFLGIQKQAPAFIHSDVERKLRDLTQLNIRNTGLRYRLATLQQKFGSYNSYWRRTMRQIENGTYARNLAKIGREAARNGAEIPEEILAAMPKRMREQVLRDRDAAIAIAKRRNQLDDGTVPEDELLTLADEPLPEADVPPPAPAPAPQKTRGGAHVLDESDADIDFNEMFAAFEDDAPKEIGGVRAHRTATRPPMPRTLPNEAQQTTVLPKSSVSVPPPGQTTALPRMPIAAQDATSAPPRQTPGAGTPPLPTSSSPLPGGVRQTPAAPIIRITPATVPPVARPAAEVAPTQPVARPQADDVAPTQPVARPTPAAGIAPTQPVARPTPAAGMPPVPPIARPPAAGIAPTQPVARLTPAAGTPIVPPTPAGIPPTQPVARPTPPAARPTPAAGTPSADRPTPVGAQGIPRFAPSQQSRPVPVIPGSAAQTGPVAVESMAGPFPRAPVEQPTSAIPRPIGQQPSAPVRATGPIPPPPPATPTSAIPRPIGQQPSGPVTTSAIPRPVGQQPSGPTTTSAIPRPAGQQPSGPANTQRPTQSIPRQQTQPVAKPPAPPQKPPPGMTEADVNALHAKYVKAKESVGEKVDAGSREKLLKTINQTAPKIMEQYKASGVDFSVVVKDNQVIIKAKPKT